MEEISTEIFQGLQKEITLLMPLQHTVAANYYSFISYLWSEIYAADMFTQFQKEGLLNPRKELILRNIFLKKAKVKISLNSLRNS